MLRPAGLLTAVRLASAACAVSAVFAAAPASAQIPGVQPPPGAQPPAAVQPPPADPKLDPHLRAWEQRMTGVTNFHAKIGLTRKEAVFNKSRLYTGSVLCMKPNYAILRSDNASEKPLPGKPVDYEVYICTGDAVYEYSGLQQAVTEYKIANAGAPGDNLMLDFLSGMKADDAKRRFQMSLFNEDANYVYIDIKPIDPKDLREFTHVRFAMYNSRLPNLAYLPAQVWLQKPNGDTELWEFKEPQTNVPNIDPKAVFKYTPVKENGKEWPLKRAGAAMPPPAGGPKLPGAGGPGLPTGSAIRP